jgi:mercuric reductase
MAERQQITLQIEGMTCDGCAGHIRKALAEVDGVHEVRLPTWQVGKAEVLVSDTVVDEALIGAVERAGYRALVREKRPVSGERKIPEMKGADYDLMIIGGGSAAFAAAIKGAELGAQVALVEEGIIGGTCVNIGCVPSKTLIRAAEHCYHAAYSQFAGLAACPPPRDWQRVIAQKDELVAALRQGKYVDVAAAYPNISILKGHAELTGGHRLAIGEKAYHPGKIIIATGSRPSAPPIPGLAEAGFLDSTDALSLPELPTSLM